MPTAVVIRHVAFEDLGLLEPMLAARGIDPRWLDAGVDDLASIDPAGAALLVVLGGPIGVYETDRYPWLEAQLAWLRRRLDARRPTLGICLGAQLIAAALGAKVRSDRRLRDRPLSLARGPARVAAPPAGRTPADAGNLPGRAADRRRAGREGPIGSASTRPTAIPGSRPSSRGCAAGWTHAGRRWESAWARS